MATAKRRFSVLDLTSEQVEAIELDIGKPVSEWGEAPSMSALYRKILAAKEGRDEAEFKSLTLRDLLAQVSLDAGDDVPNA